jgi:hypothetical protein
MRSFVPHWCFVRRRIKNEAYPRLLVTSSSANLPLLACQLNTYVGTTYIDPNGALRDQTGFSTVFELCCDQSQHVFAALKELKAGGIVDVGLGFVEALLLIWSTNAKI